MLCILDPRFAPHATSEATICDCLDRLADYDGPNRAGLEEHMERNV